VTTPAIPEQPSEADTATPYEIEARLRQDIADAQTAMNRAAEHYYKLREELTAMLGTSTLLFEGCRNGTHVCPVRYDGYGGTLICSCDCHGEKP
jgi:hypothetical protein